jgi:hypothetical protein
MASALNPHRLATLQHRLEVKLAQRKAKRLLRSPAARAGHETRRKSRSADPLLSSRARL